MAINVEALYEKYGPMVIRRCRKILRNEDDALDAVQDVFVNLLLTGLRLHDKYPSSLLFTIATNVCLNRLRNSKRLSLKDFSNEEDHKPFIDEGFEQVEAEIVMESILKDESEINRSIYFMYHIDGMTLKEIGETVGLSIAGVSKRIDAFKNRARLKLEGK